MLTAVTTATGVVGILLVCTGERPQGQGWRGWGRLPGKPAMQRLPLRSMNAPVTCRPPIPPAGALKLARLVQYVPLPVMGGYLCFVGYFVLGSGEAAVCLTTLTARWSVPIGGKRCCSAASPTYLCRHGWQPSCVKVRSCTSSILGRTRLSPYRRQPSHRVAGGRQPAVLDTAGPPRRIAEAGSRAGAGGADFAHHGTHQVRAVRKVWGGLAAGTGGGGTLGQQRPSCCIAEVGMG